MDPKLTKRQIEVPVFSKLRDNLAVQVLCHSIATGIDFVCLKSIIRASHMATSKVVQRFPRLFSLFNIFNVNDGRPKPLSKTSKKSSCYIAFFLTLSVCGGTVSAGLNSISAVILEDYVKVYVKRHIRDNKARLYSQIIAVLVSVLCLQLVLLVAKIEGIIKTATTISGILSGPILGVFTLGLLCPQATAKGALAGILGTSTLMFLFLIGKWSSTLLKAETPLFCISNCNTSVSKFDVTKHRIPQPTMDT
ncbi:sodium-coupled monocarboxylate transporter [Plakobranchus ocellatus]|uniref:Sodium-coupled monocarboxylate transporter n=1 Tax=Plakobranchus ocellatus TaxID=259542 RepID=A0AAV4C0T4_9GAST|nr:sodium-coupled monocarboxylate transporter [Plakobranchus ocellatus]